MPSRAIALILALGLGLSQAAHASLADAEAAYRRGAALERSGDSEGALVEYQAALAHYPDYFYAWRQIGNCYVRLRQAPRAVDAYDHYLTAKPMDNQVREYNDRLRRAYGSPSAAIGGTATGSGQAAAPFYVGLALHPVFLSVADINALVPDGANKASASVAMGYGVEGGWRHSSGAYLQAGWFSGLSKGNSWKESSDLVNKTVNASMSGFYLAPGYRMKLPIRWPVNVGGHLGLGLANLGFDYTTEIVSVQKTTVSASQSLLLVLADLRADALVWKQLELSAGLGYQSAQMPKISTDNGDLKDQQGGNAKLDMSGLRLDLGLHWDF